jgi:transposase
MNARRKATNVRDLVNWGFDTGNTTPEKLKLTVAARKDAAVKLVGSGMSHSQAAKVLGVERSTISKDVKNSQEDGEKFTAKEAEVKASNAKLKLVKSAPIDGQYGTIVIDPPWDMEKIKRDVRPNQADAMGH